MNMAHSCSEMPSRVERKKRIELDRRKRGPGATHRGGGCGGHGEIQSTDQSMTKDKRNSWNKPAHFEKLCVILMSGGRDCMQLVVSAVSKQARGLLINGCMPKAEISIRSYQVEGEEGWGCVGNGMTWTGYTSPINTDIWHDANAR